jgi:hypothetical protein
MTWTLLADGLPLTDSFEWEVPDMATSSTRCQLRLSVLDWLGGISVIESGEFTIDVSPPAVTLGDVGRLTAGEEATVTATCTDDVAVAEVLLRVEGLDRARTIAMEPAGDGTWTCAYVPRKGDGAIVVSASDGVHLTEGVPTEVKLASAGTGSGAASSLAVTLALVAALATITTITIFLLRRRGGRER